MPNDAYSSSESLHRFVEHGLSAHHEANTVFNRGWYIWLFFLTMQDCKTLKIRKKNYEKLQNSHSKYVL